jgi:hypothetical protein
VSAYTYGLNPSDFHAHIEAFLGGRWILFDPTRLAPQSSFVRIGQGRDAADTSFATIFGSAVMNKMEFRCSPVVGNAIILSIPPLRFRIIRARASPKSNVALRRTEDSQDAFAFVGVPVPTQTRLVELRSCCSNAAAVGLSKGCGRRTLAIVQGCRQ